VQIDEITTIMNSTQVDPISVKGQNNIESFEPWLVNKFDELNENITESDMLVRKLAMGETENLHQVMIAMEKSKLQFSLLTEVRNKLLEGYQEVMRMQI
jgi:flagellar hook-basal body complex protein FliE